MYEGVYALHIMRLLNGGFPRSQIRIYWSEDFFRNPRAIVEDALKFLGLDTGPESGMDWSRVAKPVNVGFWFSVFLGFALNCLSGVWVGGGFTIEWKKRPSIENTQMHIHSQNDTWGSVLILFSVFVCFFE